MWTIDELVDRVRLALAAEYPGAPNGRVRDVPDQRAIRWYATKGLVDRPALMRGRTALYGRRHLLQLVAIKRRQAAGHTLADIQAELSGVPDSTLAAIAQVPDHLLTGEDTPAAAEPVRARFWAGPPPPSPPPPLTPPPTAALPATTPPPTAAPLAAEAPTAAPLAGVALGGGAVLLVPGQPAADDYAAITVAARPLLDLLAARGLVTGAETTAHRRPTGGETSRHRAPRTDRSSP